MSGKWSLPQQQIWNLLHGFSLFEDSMFSQDGKEYKVLFHQSIIRVYSVDIRLPGV